MQSIISVVLLLAQLGGNGSSDLTAALAHEVDGNIKQRNHLLSQQLGAGQSTQTHWQLGYVCGTDGKWYTPEQVTQQVSAYPNWDEYVQRRKSTRRAHDHWLLSKWCRVKGLKRHSLAHNMLAAHLSPHNSQYQIALGRKQHEGRWLTAKEIARARRQTEAARQAYVAWKRRLVSLEKKLGSDSTRALAADDILSIDDPNAIPALIEILSDDEYQSVLLIRALGKIPNYNSTVALVGQAIYANWSTIRDAATAGLAERNLDHVVPLLMRRLAPDDSGVVHVPNVGNIWYWEDHRTRYIDVVTASPGNLIRNNRSSISNRISPYAKDDQVARFFPEVSKLERDSDVRSSFRATQRRNAERRMNTAQALQEVTGQSFGEDYRAWAEWFDRTTGYSTSSGPPDIPRTTRLRVRSPETVSFVAPGTVTAVSPQPVPLANIAAGTSCFAAGTPVLTDHGSVAIDHLKLGDLVLSQDTETGELAYKPVLERTIRPRTQINNLNVNGETISSTSAHPFWVSGTGWTKARDLKEGAILRGCGTAHRLSEVSTAETDELAFNLVVADFGTYFVGDSRLLVHDNTPIYDFPRPFPGVDP